MTDKKGRLSVVGSGLHPGHLTLETRAIVCDADVVLAVCPNPLSVAQLKSLNKHVENLGRFYRKGVKRDQIYREMAQQIVDRVHEGLHVCTVFYGHPGVFVSSTYQAWDLLAAAGYRTKMYPGISADACLFADLGFDPATTGCQSYEATQFLLTRREVDATSAIILWQVGLVGEHTLEKYTPAEKGQEALARLLMAYYPANHDVCVYEAPTLPGFEARIQWTRLDAFPTISLKEWSTLFVPPYQQREVATDRIAWLGEKPEAFNAWQ